MKGKCLTYIQIVEINNCLREIFTMEKAVVYICIYIDLFFSHLKIPWKKFTLSRLNKISLLLRIYTLEWNIAISKNIDEPRDYRIKWSKSEKDKYLILLICGI